MGLISTADDDDYGAECIHLLELCYFGVTTIKFLKRRKITGLFKDTF